MSVEGNIVIEHRLIMTNGYCKWPQSSGERDNRGDRKICTRV